MALAWAGSAQAETLRVESHRPARVDALVTLHTIQVERLGGRHGSDMTIQLEDGLRELQFEDRPWFRVLPASIADGEGDAVLRGNASIDLGVTEYTEERERCVKDADNRCTDTREKYNVACFRRRFELDTTLRLIGRDGSLLWSLDNTEPHEDSRCTDSSGQMRSVADVQRMLIGRIAQKIQEDFVPRLGVADVRVDESRRGLSRGDADRFREAVRLTRTNARGACDIWAELAGTNPNHLPTRFNVALCTESLGTADPAPLYREVLTMRQNHGASQAALDRLVQNRRARDQIAAHEAD